MTGYNMPPGVSPWDIPGNDAPDPSTESEQVGQMLDDFQDMLSEGSESTDPEDIAAFWRAVERRKDAIINFVEDLAVERNELAEALVDLRWQVNLASGEPK